MSKVIGDVDDYVCTLSNEILEIAKNELNEDVCIIEQSLEIFRTWILQNEDILKCRIDSSFLLRFLRQKKYSIPLAQETLMRHLLSRTIFPEFCNNPDCTDPDVKELFDNGTMVILQGRQDDGRRVIITNYGNLDVNKDMTLLGRSWGITIDTLMEDESVQITGITCVANGNDLRLQHMTVLTPRMIQQLSSAFHKSHPIRYSAIHMLGVPSYFEKIAEIFISAMGKKMKERMTVHKADTKIKDVVSLRILPKEYGGNGPSLEETIKAWNDEMLARRPRVLLNSEMAIDERYKDLRSKEMFKNEHLGIEGTFRKLQID